MISIIKEILYNNILKRINNNINMKYIAILLLILALTNAKNIREHK